MNKPGKGCVTGGLVRAPDFQTGLLDPQGPFLVRARGNGSSLGRPGIARGESDTQADKGSEPRV